MEDRPGKPGEVLTGKGGLPGHQFVEDDAELVDVGPGIGPSEPLGRDLLRGRIREGESGDGGIPARLQRRAHAPVGDLRGEIAREKNVPWLDVAVDDAPLMGVSKPCGDACSDAGSGLHGERFFHVTQGPGQILHLDEGHREDVDRVDCHDVWVGEVFPEPHLLHEGPAGGLVIGDRDLHSHLMPVVTPDRPEDLPEPAPPDEGDLVVAFCKLGREPGRVGGDGLVCAGEDGCG